MGAAVLLCCLSSLFLAIATLATIVVPTFFHSTSAFESLFPS
jgi:hypothetical protein